MDTSLPILYRSSSAFVTKFLPPHFAKSIRSIEILAALPRQMDSSIVFWAPRGGPFSDAPLAAVMRKQHAADIRGGGVGFTDAQSARPVVSHGLRTTFRTWVAEQTQFDGDMAEIALAHRVGSKVQQAYDRSDQLEKRRDMMAAWGDFLQGVLEGFFPG